MGGQPLSRYGEIVADIARQIDSGELAPGDRVPSTREITRRWGVAMATATKVLTELRHQGLARAVPGVGTVVADRPARGRSTAPRPAAPMASPPRRETADGLTTRQIVATAVAVADAEGLAAVSMRRIAAELGAAPMSLYRHVADKDELLLLMMNATFDNAPLPATPPAGWRDRLELAARTLWGLFRQHSWLASALSLTRPQLIPSAMPYTEWVLSTLDGLGLELPTAFTVHLALLNYVRGTAINLEMEVEAQAQTGLDIEEWMQTQEQRFQAVLDTDRFPYFARLAAGGYDFNLDALFEFGLQRLLDGLAVVIET